MQGEGVTEALLCIWPRHQWPSQPGASPARVHAYLSGATNGHANEPGGRGYFGQSACGLPLWIAFHILIRVPLWTAEAELDPF
jgi:hypothetical protein